MQILYQLKDLVFQHPVQSFLVAINVVTFFIYGVDK